MCVCVKLLGFRYTACQQSLVFIFVSFFVCFYLCFFIFVVFNNTTLLGVDDIKHARAISYLLQFAKLIFMFVVLVVLAQYYWLACHCAHRTFVFICATLAVSKVCM